MLPVKMNDNEVTELCQRYGHPAMKDQVKWKAFVDDIDQGMDCIANGENALFYNNHNYPL